MDDKTFCIVYFPKENCYEYISSSWLVGEGKCMWPTGKKASKVNELRTHHANPTLSWRTYTITMQQDSVTRDEGAARKKLRKIVEKAETDTTDPNEPRRKKAVRRFLFEQGTDRPRDGSQSTSYAHASAVAQRPAVSSDSSSQSSDESDIEPAVIAASASSPQEALTPEFRAFRTMMCREMSALALKVDECHRMLSSICIQKGVQLELPVQLPMTTEEDVTRMEEWLETDENIDNLAKQVAIVGGSGVKDCARRMLKKVMKPELWVRFSYKGLRQKRPFEKLALNTVLKKSLRLSCGASDASTEAALKDILRHAQDYCH